MQGSGGRALGKVVIPPNLFSRLDSVIRKMNPQKRNRLFKRHRVGKTIIYSIFEREIAAKIFHKFGVSAPLFEFTSKKGFPFKGLIDHDHPLTIHYSGPKANLLRMRLFFQSGNPLLT